MVDVVLTGTTYKLRAGAPMPIAGQDFVLHTFMAEESEVKTYLYTEDLPSSSDMRGQGGDFVSASYNRLEGNGGKSFSGRTVKSPDFVDEDLA